MSRLPSLLLLVPALSMAQSVYSGRINSPVAVTGGSRGLDITDTNGYVARVEPNGAVISGRDVEYPGQTGFAAMTPRGRYYIGGATVADKTVSTWIAAVDDRTITWQRTIGYGKHFWSIAAAVDDRAVYVLQSLRDIVVAKLDAKGELAWGRRYADRDESTEGTAIAVAAGGGAVVGGRIGGVPVAFRIDPAGDVVWSIALGPCGKIEELVAAADGGFFALVRCTATGPARRELLKITNEGVVAWSRSFEGIDAIDDLGVAGNGDAIVLGSVTGEKRTGVVAAIGNDGTLRWARSFDGVRQSVNPRQTNKTLIVPSGDGAAVVAELDSKPALMLFARDGSGPCNVRNAAVTLADSKRIATPDELAGTAAEIVVSSVPVKGEETVTIVANAIGCATAESAAPAIANAAFEARRAEIAAFKQKAADDFLARRFEALDALADKHRKDGALFSPLSTKLVFLYDAVEELPSRGRLSRDAYYAMLQEWLAARPRSVAARMLLAERCGRDVATLLGDARAIADDPAADVAALRCGLMQPADLVKGAPRRPIYFRSYLNAAYDLMGDPHAFKAFLERAGEQTAVDMQNAVYARLGASIVARGLPLADYGLSWPRMREGFRELMSRDPDWIPTHHLFAAMAVAVGDRETTRELFVLPQLQWSNANEVLQIWVAVGRRGSEPDAARRVWAEAKAWATTGSASPLPSRGTSGGS